MSAFILKPGLQTTLQGGPRTGYRHQGLPWAGAADLLSLSIANHLVGNAPTALAIETTYGGLRLRFEKKVQFALTGADAPATLAGAAIEPHRTQPAEAGQVLDIGHPAAGLRTYLSVAGGWHGTTFLGNASTYLPAGLGGLEGRALKAGDTLDWYDDGVSRPLRQTPKALRFPFQRHWSLRATNGPDFKALSEESQRRLYGTEFTASPQSNRMGVGLSSTPLELSADARMRSVATFPGLVQCPPGGQPVILLVDGGTTGGYPRVAQIARCDRHLLGQVRPGDHIRLLPRSVEDAHMAFIDKQRLVGDHIGSTGL